MKVIKRILCYILLGLNISLAIYFGALSFIDIVPVVRWEASFGQVLSLLLNGSMCAWMVVGVVGGIGMIINKKY